MSGPDEKGRLEREVDRLQMRVDELRALLLERNRELVAAYDQLAEARGLLDGIRGSKIWRWSAPLRALLDRLGGAPPP